MTPLPRVGRYELLSPIGSGGMGRVSRARAPDGTLVALKQLTWRDPAGLSRFEREARGLLRVRHPNVVQLLDAGTHEGAPFLVMELVTGEALERKLEREEPMAPRAAALLVRTVGRALEHCHQEGILHRDVKPANVLLRASDGEPLLSNFGLARAIDASVALTRTGRVGVVQGGRSLSSMRRCPTRTGCEALRCSSFVRTRRRQRTWSGSWRWPSPTIRSCLRCVRR